MIGAVLSFWFAALKRQVSIRTKDLKEEIEERKGVEEALRESELSYRTLAENLPGLVYRVLIREKGRMQFFNDMLQTMTGYRTGELKKGEICSIEPLILPEDLGGVAISVEEAIKKKTPFEVEYRILHKDGNIRYFSERGRPVFGEDGNPLFIDGSIFEITERKQAEEALREGEAKYKSLTNNLNVGVFRNSVGSKGKFIEGNPAIVKMFGYDSKEEFLKIGVSNLYINSHERKEFSSKIEKAGSVKNEVLELQKKDGTVLIGSVSAVAVKNKNDGIKYFDGIIEDITEQKRAEEEKKKLESQFIHAQRMESIGTLAGGIAHDFNNLLMAIQGRASTMLTNKDVSSPDFEHLRGIEDYVESAADLTKQLLGFAMGGEYEVKPTDLNALIDKQNRMFGRTKKEIIIKSKYQENIWPVEIDRGQIDQVLLNLYVNAWQAMPGGGELFLETENVTLDEDDVKPFATEPGRYVKISVSDTGVGMDKATLERIFGILHLSQKVVYTFVISRFRREIGNWKLEIRKKHINSGVLSNF